MKELLYTLDGICYIVRHRPLINPMKLVGTDEWEKEEVIWLTHLVM